MGVKKKRIIIFLIIIIVILVLVIGWLLIELDNKNTMLNNSLNIDKNEDISDSEFVQFDDEFYSLEDIAIEYRISSNIKNYKDFNYDIDGDGVVDKITIEKDKERDSIYIYKLNGIDFVEHYDVSWIYIVDLNEDDDQKEVVIFDHGPSDDFSYTIYVKDEDKMVRLLDFLPGRELKCDKKGTILIRDNYNGKILPLLYFNYYYIVDGKISSKCLDINKVKGRTFRVEDSFKTWLFFSKDYNVDVINMIDEITEEGFSKIGVNVLDKEDGFEILEYEMLQDGEKKIRVKLSDGTLGYLFYIQLAG